MEKYVLLFLACTVISSSAWSLPYYPVPRAPIRVTRYAAPPHHLHRIPVHEAISEQQGPQWQRAKRGHHEYDDDHRGSGGSSGVTGPVHTFVKTDKNANYKWGVRHHVGDKFAS